MKEADWGAKSKKMIIESSRMVWRSVRLGRSRITGSGERVKLVEIRETMAMGLQLFPQVLMNTIGVVKSVTPPAPLQVISVILKNVSKA